jgi:hypothetical protein
VRTTTIKVNHIDSSIMVRTAHPTSLDPGYELLSQTCDLPQRRGDAETQRKYFSAAKLAKMRNTYKTKITLSFALFAFFAAKDILKVFSASQRLCGEIIFLYPQIIPRLCFAASTHETINPERLRVSADHGKE